MTKYQIQLKQSKKIQKDYERNLIFSLYRATF